MSNIRKKSFLMKSCDDSCGIYCPRNKNPNIFAWRVMDFLDNKGANVLNDTCWMLIFSEDFKNKRKHLVYKKNRIGSVTWYKMAADCYVAVTNLNSINIENLTHELMICLKNTISYEIGKLKTPITLKPS